MKFYIDKDFKKYNCEWCNGTKHWYCNGKLHREDGPAIEYSDGTKRWYLNNELVENMPISLNFLTRHIKNMLMSLKNIIRWYKL